MATLGPRTTLNRFAWPELRSPFLVAILFSFVSHRAVKCLVLLHVCSGWSSDCVGVGMKVGVCLINLVCLGATQIELEGWRSSPQPLNSTGREVRA